MSALSVDRLADWLEAAEIVRKRERAAAKARRDARPHYIYRCFSADDRLLYVGCTSDVAARMRSHEVSVHGSAHSAFVTERTAYYTVQRFTDKAAARKAERLAIASERPLINIQHHPAPLSERERNALFDELAPAS